MSRLTILPRPRMEDRVAAAPRTFHRGVAVGGRSHRLRHGHGDVPTFAPVEHGQLLSGPGAPGALGNMMMAYDG